MLCIILKSETENNIHWNDMIMFWTLLYIIGICIIFIIIINSNCVCKFSTYISYFFNCH